MVSKSVRRRLARQRNANGNTTARGGNSSGGQRLSNVSSFARCALNPFSGVGMVNGVPDRFDGNVVVIENETLKNYTFESDWDMIFMILPCFGKNLFICKHDSDGKLVMKGSVAVDAVVGPDEAYKFTSFRTISLGCRITYVGKPLDASGVIFATQFRLRLGDIIDAKVKNASFSEDAFEIVKADPKPIAVRVFDPFSISPGDIMSSPDSSMVRIGQGCVLVAKHSSADSWNFSDIWEDDCALTDMDVTQGNANLSYENLLGGDSKLMKGYDPGSYGILFRVTGHQSGAKVVFETRHCIEAIPSLDTGVYRTLARPSARRDPAAIDLVVDAQRKLPVAVEGGVTNWGSAITKALSGIDIASVVRRVGAMALGPGVAALERILF